MPQLHSLLKRQLKNMPAERLEDPAVAKFIENVNQTYFDSDADRNMLERSLDLSSHELSQLTASLVSSNRELEQFAGEMNAGARPGRDGREEGCDDLAGAFDVDVRLHREGPRAEVIDAGLDLLRPGK